MFDLATNEGNEMAQDVLHVSQKLICCRTLQKVTVKDIISESEESNRSIFNDIVLKKLGDSVRKLETMIDSFIPYSDNDDLYPISCSTIMIRSTRMVLEFQKSIYWSVDCCWTRNTSKEYHAERESSFDKVEMAIESMCVYMSQIQS